MVAGFVFLFVGISLLLADWIDTQRRVRQFAIRRRFSTLPPQNGHVRRRKLPWWEESPQRE